MATRDEIIRLLLKTEGGEQISALVKEFDSLGAAGTEAEGKVNGLLDEIKSSKDLQATVDKYRELGKSFVDYAQKLTVGKAEIAALSAQEKESAKALDIQRSALEQARKELASFKDGTVAYLGSQKQIAAAQNEAKAKVSELTQAFKAAESTYKSNAQQLDSARTSVERLAGAQDKLRAPLAGLKTQLAEAGLSATNLAAAEEALAAKGAAAVAALNRVAEEARRSSSQIQTLTAAKTKLRGAIDQANAGLISFVGNLARITGIAGIVSSALTALSGVRFFSGAAQSAKEFESTLSEVRAVSGATADQLARMRIAAEQASATTKFSANDAAKALGELARATGDADKAISALPATLNLAQAAGIGVSESAIILTTTLTQFGLGADQAARAADLFTREANSTQDTVQGLGLAMGYTAPLARQLGLSLEQTTAVLGAMAEQGFRGERAGTALRNVFSKLLDPTSSFSQALFGLGINTKDFGQVIEQLAAKGDKGRKALLELDAEARPAIQALVTSGGAGIKRLISDFQDAAGESARTAQTMGDNFEGASARFDSAFDKFRRALVEPLLEPLAKEFDNAAVRIRAFVQTADFAKIQESIKSFAIESVTAFRSFVEGIDFKKVAQDISDFASSAKTALSDFKSSLSGITTTVVAFGKGVILAFDALKTGIFTIAAVVTNSISKTQGVLEDFLRANLAAQIAEKFGLIPPAVKDAEGAINGLGAVSDEFGKRAATAASDTAAAFDSLSQTLMDTSTSGETAKAGVDQTSESIGVLKTSSQAASDALSLVPNYLNDVANAGASAGPAIFALSNAVKSTSDELDKAQDRFDAATRNLYNVQNAAGSTADQIQVAKSAFFDARNELQKLRPGAEDATNSLRLLQQAFATLHVTSQADLNATRDAAKLAFDTIVEGAKAGAATQGDVQAAFAAYSQAATAAAANTDATNKSQVESNLKVQASVLGIKDALKTAGTTGEDAGKKVSESYGSASQAIDSAAQSAGNVGASAKSASKDLDSAADSASNLGNSIHDSEGVAAALSDAVKSARGEFSALSEAAGQLFDKNLDAFGARFINAISGIEGAAKAISAAADETRVKVDQEREAAEGLAVQFSNLSDAAIESAVKTAGSFDEAARRMQGIASAANEGRFATNLLGKSDLSGLASAAQQAAQRILQVKQASEDAQKSLEDLGRTLQDELDRSAGNNQAIEDRRFAEQLKQIDELAKKGGANAIAEAARIRELARKEHERRLKEIKDQGDAQIASDNKVAANRNQETSKPQSSGVGGLSGANRNQQPVVNINNPVLLSPKDLDAFSRQVKQHIDAIILRSR